MQQRGHPGLWSMSYPLGISPLNTLYDRRCAHTVFFDPSIIIDSLPYPSLLLVLSQIQQPFPSIQLLDSKRSSRSLYRFIRQSHLEPDHVFIVSDTTYLNPRWCQPDFQ